VVADEQCWFGQFGFAELCERVDEFTVDLFYVDMRDGLIQLLRLKGDGGGAWKARRTSWAALDSTAVIVCACWSNEVRVRVNLLL
jgi:hypothetical protein